MVQREAKPSNLLKGDLERNVKDKNSLRASVQGKSRKRPIRLSNIKSEVVEYFIETDDIYCGLRRSGIGGMTFKLTTQYGIQNHFSI
jgi:hypothetical protein